MIWDKIGRNPENGRGPDDFHPYFRYILSNILVIRTIHSNGTNCCSLDAAVYERYTLDIAGPPGSSTGIDILADYPEIKTLYDILLVH